MVNNFLKARVLWRIGLSQQAPVFFSAGKQTMPFRLCQTMRGAGVLDAGRLAAWGYGNESAIKTTCPGGGIIKSGSLRSMWTAKDGEHKAGPKGDGEQSHERL